MARYANNFRYAGNLGDWQFITTDSEQTLAPILNAYNQQVQRDVSSDGSSSVGFSHILRVFLIDPQKRIRNIYNVDFLHQALVLNDIKTLIRQADTEEKQANSAHAPKKNAQPVATG